MYLRTAEEAVTAFNLAFIPGKYLAETFPLMRFIPEWVPGAKFRQEAAGWRPSGLRMRNQPRAGPMDKIVSTSPRFSSICLIVQADAVQLEERRQSLTFNGRRSQGAHRLVG